MSTISSVNNSNVYNPQITNKVAAANSSNLANNAANQSAFSSYIGQALAQIGVSNPTNLSAPVVSGANKSNAKEQEEQKSVSTFIQDLFSILGKNNSPQTSTAVNQQQTSLRQAISQDNEDSESSSDSETTDVNEAAIAAYTGVNSTTVGNLVTNLQSLIKQLNDESRNTENNSSSTIQALKDGFQSVLNAQGATTENPASLGIFLNILAQNIDGESPLGIIVNTQA